MAIKSGFFDSLDGDRKYNAEDFGDVMSMAVTDGVDNNYLDELIVTAGSGLTVNVGGGRCFFNKHFLINDSAYNLSLQAASNNLSRIDAIIVDVKGSNSFRTVTLDVVTGTQSSSPVRPTLIKNDSQKRWQYALAYVTIPAGAVNVQASNIEDVRGTSSTPWIYKTGEFDAFLNNSSTNAPQTKVVANEISAKQVTMKNYVDSEILDVFEVMGYNGAKNLLGFTIQDIKNSNGIGTWSGDTFTREGITYTFTTNESGYVTEINASGTSGNTFVFCYLCASTKFGNTTLDSYYAPSANGYTLSGGIDSGKRIFYDVGEHRIYIKINANTTLTNAKFYPMIRHNEDTDTTYQPYAMTNKDLTPLVQNVAVRTSYTATSGQTLEQAIISWADANKDATKNKYNLVASINHSSLQYTMFVNMLTSTGVILGGILTLAKYEAPNIVNHIWGVFRDGSTCSITELAPKDWAEPRLTFAGKSVTVPAHSGVGVTIPLPSGYTTANSRIVSADIVDGNGVVYSLYYGSSTYNLSSDLYMDSSGIHTTVNNGTGSSATLMLRVYLQKTFGIYG